MKIEYRGKTINLPRPIELARQGEYGKDWYTEAEYSIKEYANAKGFTAERVADVLAITSPRVSVKHNVTLATRYLETGSTQGMMLGRIRALQRYERTGEFSGPKVTAFSKALQGDSKAVVVDSWMVLAFSKISVSKNPSLRTHKYISRVVRSSSTILGWEPAQTQAAIWVAVRSHCGFTNSKSQLLLP